MGDGAILNKGLVLCTDIFTLQDVIKLINILIIKYNINCNMIGYKHKKPRIYIMSKSLPDLIKLVRPYMLDPMLYKLKLQN